MGRVCGGAECDATSKSRGRPRAAPLQGDGLHGARRGGQRRGQAVPRRQRDGGGERARWGAAACMLTGRGPHRAIWGDGLARAAQVRWGDGQRRGLVTTTHGELSRAPWDHWCVASRARVSIISAAARTASRPARPKLCACGCVAPAPWRCVRSACAAAGQRPSARACLSSCSCPATCKASVRGVEVKDGVGGGQAARKEGARPPTHVPAHTCHLQAARCCWRPPAQSRA